MELKQYIQPLLKWWWLILAATLIAALSSTLVTMRLPATYRTSVTLMLGSAINDPNPKGSEIVLTQELSGTYAAMAQRSIVRRATMEALGLSWLPDYTVTVVPDTQLLELTVVDTDPARTQAVANELARQLVAISPTSADNTDAQRQAFIDQELNDLEVTILATKGEMDKKQSELANMFSARQIADTQSQLAGLQNKLTLLQANYAALLSNSQQGALNRINVLEPAELPTTPVGPNRLATILLAAAIGFLLAAGAAHLLEYLDDTIKNPDDVQRDLGLTTLGAVPVFEHEDGDELPLLTSQRSAPTEAFRVLRTNLQFAAVDRPLQTLVITSASPGEGKSLSAANLAASLAMGDRKVILVDTDLHRPRQHRIFKTRNNLGVTSALLHENPNLDEILQETSLPNLWIMTSGPLPPNSAELLGSARMRQLLVELTARADIVLLDSPPVTVLADAAILATQSDGVLLVLSSGQTRRPAAQRALQALSRVDARVVGAVLNRLPLRGAGYYYYYEYNRYYSANDGDDGTAPSGRRARRASARREQLERQRGLPTPAKPSGSS